MTEKEILENLSEEEREIYLLEKKVHQKEQEFQRNLVNKIIEKIPEFNQEEFRIGLLEAIQTVKIKFEPQINVPETEIPEPKVKVVRVETERVVEKLRDKISIDGIEDLISELKTAIEKDDLAQVVQKTKLGDAIRVKLTDTFFGGGPTSEVWTKNVSGDRINPATEDKQDSIITELQQIEEGTDKIPADPSTESKQDDANALLATIDTSLNNIEADVEDIDTRLANIESDTDPLAKYAIVDKDDDAEPNYFGFEDGDGNWYIMKEESNAYRYTAGTSDYSTNWGNRASLSYDYRGATSIA